MRAEFRLDVAIIRHLLRLHEMRCQSSCSRARSSSLKICGRFPIAGEPRYLLERQIAEEATCIVYQGTDTLTGAVVAMKVPKSLLFQTQREVEILQHASHRDIIQLHDYFESPDGPVIIFPLAAGDLFGFIPLDGFDEATVKQIIHKVLLALAYLHLYRNRIWHRGIKPENILVMSLEDLTDVLLTDFRLANAFPGGICRDRQCIRSRPFVAPGMYKNITYTERVDIWSLGVTMYTPLTGMYPFDYTGREPVDLIHDMLPRLTVREQLGKLSTAGREVVMLMLQENPVHRITASGALKLNWFEGMATEQQATGSVEGVEERPY
jgi:serine/threonine protein kinase